MSLRTLLPIWLVLSSFASGFLVATTMADRSLIAKVQTITKQMDIEVCLLTYGNKMRSLGDKYIVGQIDDGDFRDSWVSFGRFYDMACRSRDA